MPFTPPHGIGHISGTAITVSVPQGASRTALVPEIVHNGASINPPSGVAQDFTSPVQYTVTAQDGTTRVYTVNVNVATAPVDPDPPVDPPPGGSAMQVGTNFWFLTRPDDNWSGEAAMVPGINWATAYGAGIGGLGTTNIWNPAWLTELAPYAALRFMDWGNTNWSEIVDWSQRRLPTQDNYEAYIDGTSNPDNPGVAYEWMIDVCNRTGKDLWVCLPAKSSQNYWTQLATLIHSKLNPARKVYIEYSNETWNGTFGQFNWVNSQGVTANLPGLNQFYQGQAFCVWQSIKIFDAFEAVFGAPAMGSRVIRVFAYGGNMDTGRQGLSEVYQSATWNPNNTKIDMLAMAPYIGHSLNGLSPTITADFHAEIDTRLASEIAEAAEDQTTFQIPLLGCYEAGQHLTTNAGAWTQNPEIYDEYRYMLDRWSLHFDLFMHYTHTGRWSAQQAWGALDQTGQSASVAHKYRALVDWKLANP